MITVDEALARGIALPTDAGAAQDIIDEQEAWLARRIGPLEGDRTETFYVGLAVTHGKLALARYTDAVVLTDAGVAVNALHFRLIDNGSAVIQSHTASSRWWTGPYVTATYEPNDADEVRHVLFDFVALALQPIGPFSEKLGDYSYSRGLPGSETESSIRAARIASLLPKRDPAITIYAVSRRIGPGDPVINRAESWY